MLISFSVLSLSAVLTLSLFLCVLDLLLWYVRREDRVPLLLAAWLGATAGFALFRLLQYAPLSEQSYIVISRVVLTLGYSLGWVGYEIANTFARYRPPRWERGLVGLLVVAPILLLWAGSLIVTDQVVIRTIAFGGEFHGVMTGPLYLPANFLILAVGAVAPIRLLRASKPHRGENLWMAAGFTIVILFSLADFLAVSSNLSWIRLSDYGYLPMAIFFSFIQVQRFGKLYRDMDVKVEERTLELRQANETLRASEERYRRLINTAQDLILTVAKDGTFTSLNPSFETLTGWRCEEWVGRSFYEWIFEEDRPRAHALIERVLQVETLRPLRLRVFTKTGKTSIVELNLSPQAKDGQVVGVLGIARDITQKKQVEDALIASERRFRSLVEHGWDAFALVDAQTTIQYASSSSTRLLGYPLDEFVGVNAVSLFHEDEVAYAREKVLEVLQAPGKVVHMQVRVRHKDGSWRWMEGAISNLTADPDVKALVINYRDITERKQAEDAVRESEDQYRRLVEHLPFGVAIHVGGKVVYANRTVARLIGMKDAKEILGKPVMDFVHPSSRAAVLQRLKEMAAGKEVPLLEEKFVSLDGQAFDVEVMAYPFIYQGKPAVQVVFQDITERKQKDTALRVLNVDLERSAREATAIAEVGRDISETLQLNVVLERIASSAKDLLQTETSAVYLPEPGKPTLKAIVAYGPDSEEIKNDLLQLGEGILGNIAMQKAGEIVNNSTVDPRGINIQGTETPPHEHLMGVPVVTKGHLAGLIAVWRTGEGNEFRSTDLDFLSRLAGQVAVAIENARMFTEEQKRREEAETLRDAAQKISSTLNQEQAIQLILEQLAKVLRYESASVQLIKDEHLEIVGGRGWTDPSNVLGMRFPILADNPNSLVILERRPVKLGNAPQAYSLFTRPPHNHIQSWLGVPLAVRDRVIGMFAVEHSQPDFFTDEDAGMVNAFAGQAAIAIENARLFEEIQKHLRRLEILQTIASALRLAQNMDEALPIVLDQLITLLDVGSALVDLQDPAGKEIVTALAHGVWAPFTGLRTPTQASVSGHVISSGQPYTTTHFTEDGIIPDSELGLVGDLNVAACVPIVAQQQPIGALWIGRHGKAAVTEEEIKVLVAVGEMVGNTIHRMSLHEQTEDLLKDLQVANRELSQAYDTTLEGWAKALEMRDKETEGHSRRVTELTLNLARRCGIPDDELIHIRRGVILHDIGKMGIPDQLLKKTGPLTQDEWVEMKKHTIYAEELLRPITYLGPALDIPIYHHEKWDGSGYPRGLKGEEIPLSARIFAVVDVYDALLYDRPYRAAWSHGKVLNYLRQESGKHFDPRIVDVFLALVEKAKTSG